MTRKPYKKGDYKAVCDRTGFRMYASEMRMQWDGVFVRKKSSEARHPQDVIKSKKDYQTVPIPRPTSDPVFIEVGDVVRGDL
jgi:hypothetical protein